MARPAPLDTSRPFTRAEALAAGITPKQLRSQRYRRVLRDVYVRADAPPHHEERIAAALLVHPAAARASHSSAARVYGLPVPYDTVVHISVAEPGDRRWRPGVKPHLSPAGIEPALRRGLKVSPPARLFVELASMLDLVDLVVAGDALLQVTGWSRRRLVAALSERRTYWTGKALWAADYLREGVDSPMESRVRMLVVLAGLPEPAVNHALRDEEGRVVIRLDLSWPDVRVAVEYDGRQHAERREQWERDVDREIELREDRSWTVLKVVSEGLYVDPTRTVERIARALRERGAWSGRLSEEYLLHFPGRRRTA